jgi:DNA-binding Lrp family transcriptional regulator
MTDFFISYVQADRDWAEWIGWVLEEAGHHVRNRARNFKPTSSNRAARESGRILAILSPDYLNSPYVTAEWTTALASGKLATVGVRGVNVERILSPIVYIDLVGLNEAEARERLVRGVTPGRRKPERPRFPGSPAPHFPGAAPAAAPEVERGASLLEKLPLDKVPDPAPLPPGSRMPHAVNPMLGSNPLNEVSMSKKLRKNILMLLEEHARTGSPDFKDDTEIANRLGVPVGEIQRQLDMLESQGLITSANSYGGHAARISSRGSLAVERLEESSDESGGLNPVAAGSPSKESDSRDMVGIFISHSHHDVELVQQLIELLRAAFNLNSRQIRATSVDGFRLAGGSSTDEQLRAEIHGSKVLIGLISNSSLRSAYVTFELGARWGSGKPMIPLLAPDVGPEALEGPLKNINALSCKSAAQLHQLVEDVATHLGTSPDRAAAYANYVTKIAKSG